MSYFKFVLIITMAIVFIFVEQTSAKPQQPQHYYYYGSRPYRYGFEQPIAVAAADPYGNGGTHSTWQDSIVLHLFG